jgi:hypothetical protein
MNPRAPLALARPSGRSALRSLALAIGVALGAALTAGCGHPFVAATPPGFVDLGDRYPRNEYRATTADGVVIGVRAWDNDPHGELSFWTRALERRMRDLGGYALLEKRDVAARGGLTGVAMRFGHDEGKTPYLYTVALFVTDKKIYVVEAGGSKVEVAKVEPQINWAIQNLAPK